jgi:MFS family permease
VVFIAAQFLKRDPETIGAVPFGETGDWHSNKSRSDGHTFEEALRTSQFWIVLVMMFWFGIYAMSYNVHIVPDAINSGMPSTMAANILALTGALLIVGRIALGTIADKTGNKPIFILGFIVAACGLFLIIFTQAHWAFFVLAVMIGFSQGGIGTSQSPLVASLFGLRSHGLILGCIGFGYTIGAALGPLLTGYIFDSTGSYHWALLMCCAASLAALAFAFLLRPTAQG